jgi:hypothetical protein
MSLSEALAQLRNAAERQRGKQPSAGFRNAMNALLRIPGVDHAGEISRLMAATDSPGGAGLLAIWLGSGVEQGKYDPEITAAPIVETFLKWSRTIETAPEADESDDAAAPEEPEPDSETITGLQFLGQALVAHLARSPKQRLRVAETKEIRGEIERIEHLSYGAMWVLQLLRQQSSDLLVLEIERRRGVLVRYENIANCFHLFTLLQEALAPVIFDVGDPSRPPPEGKGDTDDHHRAWWHYGQGDTAQANMAASVWGEMSPDGIVRIDGTQVMLLWPPILGSRTWSASFCGPILEAAPPGVTVTKVLPLAEVEAWWSRLKLPAPNASRLGA